MTRVTDTGGAAGSEPSAEAGRSAATAESAGTEETAEAGEVAGAADEDAADDNEQASPPVADRRPVQRTHHGDTFVDDYEWLRDPKSADTLAYLTAENAYAESRTAHLEGLRQEIFDEFARRTEQTDTSVPVRRGDWWYFRRIDEGQQYHRHCRAPAGTDHTPPRLDASSTLPGEELLLDGNAEAEGSEFFSLGGFAVTPDGNRLAYAVDLAGDERYTVRIKDLLTGELLPDTIEKTSGSLAWSLDGSQLYYLTVDEAWRPEKLWRRTLGQDRPDPLLFHEPDERFWVSLGTSRDHRHLVVGATSKNTSEWLLADAGSPEPEIRVFTPRVDGVEYMIEPLGDQVLVLHNREGSDFSLAVAPVSATGADDWHTVIAHQQGRRIVDVAAFEAAVAVEWRLDGLSRLAVLRRNGDGFGEPSEIPFAEPIYTAGLADSSDHDSPTVRIGFASMVTPSSVFDYEFATGQLHLRKQQRVLDGYNPDDYVQAREWATAPDGTRVPISIVRRVDRPAGPGPFLLYGYGAYEMSMDPNFSIFRLSMLDRGFAFGIAHVRGGGEMGRHWYDDGKMLHKRNTFTDFVACARHVADAGWTTPADLVIRGGSAGGLLVGAVLNLAPDAVRACQAAVPFVDALTSMLMPDLPLTVVEWEEWGDPLHDPEMYAYMKSYSPYENIAARPYPAILATTSLNDTRVLFCEPAKWVAKLRATIPNPEAVLLKTEMSAGHGGRSGRYDAWREEAFDLAWICDQVGATSRL